MEIDAVLGVKDQPHRKAGPCCTLSGFAAPKGAAIVLDGVNVVRFTPCWTR